MSIRTDQLWTPCAKEVVARTAADGWTAFESSSVGTGKDNPADPLDLTALQKARAVTLYYQNTACFEIALACIPPGADDATMTAQDVRRAGWSFDPSTS